MAHKYCCAAGTEHWVERVMCKFCWSVVVVLVLVVTGLAYKFIIQGVVVERADDRTTIQLDKNVRDLVLSEMRTFLQSVQQITSGVAKDDMALVSSAALRSGRDAEQLGDGDHAISQLSVLLENCVDCHAVFKFEIAVSTSD